MLRFGAARLLQQGNKQTCKRHASGTPSALSLRSLSAAQAQDLKLRALMLLQGDERVRQPKPKPRTKLKTLSTKSLGAAQAQDLQLRALTLLQGDERVRQRLGGSISAAPGGLSTRRA